MRISLLFFLLVAALGCGSGNQVAKLTTVSGENDASQKAQALPPAAARPTAKARREALRDPHQFFSDLCESTRKYRITYAPRTEVLDHHLKVSGNIKQITRTGQRIDAGGWRIDVGSCEARINEYFPGRGRVSYTIKFALSEVGKPHVTEIQEEYAWERQPGDLHGRLY